MESSFCSCRLKRPPSQIKTCALTKSSRGGASIVFDQNAAQAFSNWHSWAFHIQNQHQGWMGSLGALACLLFIATFRLTTVCGAGPWLVNENFHWSVKYILKVLSTLLLCHLFPLMTFRFVAAIQRKVSFMPLVATKEGIFYGKNASRPRHCPRMGNSARKCFTLYVQLRELSRIYAGRTLNTKSSSPNTMITIRGGGVFICIPLKMFLLLFGIHEGCKIWHAY